MIDPELAPVPCPDCGQLVVLAADRSCPLCKLRDAAAVDPHAVPAGPWPRLALVRGEPLGAGALWVGLPAGVTELVVDGEVRAVVASDGRDQATLVARAPGLRVNGVEAVPGAGVPLPAGARVRMAGRELART